MAKEFDLESSPQIQGIAALAKTLPKNLQTEFDSFLQTISQGQSVSATVTGNKKIADEVQKEFIATHDAFLMRYSEEIYARPLVEGKPVDGQMTFQHLEAQDLEKEVTRIYLKKTHTVDGQQIENIIKSLKKVIRLKREEVQLDNSLIEITPGLFWDGKDGTFSDAPTGLCARRLFDTKMGGKNVVKYEPGAFDEYADNIVQYADAVESEMLESDGDLREDPRLDFISTWSDGNHETYMDILRMFASNFMEPKPFGVYMLVGEGRNGKSVCIGLLHTIFGTSNTTRIQIKQLGEWHYNLEFANTLLNAPDEEENKIIEDQALFKSLADHGEVKLARMARQDALTVRGDFMIIVPMNHTPKWPKDGAEACIRRTRIIAFNADLSKEDAKPVDFAKETFTPKRVAFLLGTVLGVARYYLSHQFPDSSAMVEERKALEEEMVSGKAYRERLQKYFNGYKIRELEKDYKLWCEAKQLPQQPSRSFKRLFQKYNVRGDTNFSVSSSKTKKGIRMSPGKNLLYNDFVVPEFNNVTVKQCHDRGFSVVAMLDNEYEEMSND